MSPEPKATGPDLGPILEIHRAEDSWVRFSRTAKSGALVPITSLKVAELEQMFPEFREQLTRDAYFSLNSFWREATAKTEDLRYLNVCYSDLDYYKAGTTAGAALQAIYDAQREGLIPPASILADSGRGFWAFWLLVSPTEPGRPERYYRRHPEKLTRYRRVQMALHKTLKKIEPSLEPDPNARDASRIAPVPGTIKSKTERPVRYLIQAGDDMRGYAYTLRDLEQHFGLELEAPVEPRQLIAWGGEKRIAANRSGYRALHSARIGDLETLWEARRGFREGHRNAAALVYACHLRGLGREDGEPFTEEEIRERVEELAADCTPPLSLAEAHAAATSSRRRYLFSDAELIRRLEITEAELEALSSIRADRPERRKPGPKPKEIKAQRQAAILEIVERLGGQPSTRRMAVLLAGRGLEVTYRTVARDYAELALSGPQLAIEYGSPILEAVRREGSAVEELIERIDVEVPGYLILECWHIRIGKLELAEPGDLATWALAEALEERLYREPEGGGYRRRIGRPERNVAAEVPGLLAGPQRAELLTAALENARQLVASAEEAWAELTEAQNRPK